MTDTSNYPSFDDENDLEKFINLANEAYDHHKSAWHAAKSVDDRKHHNNQYFAASALLVALKEKRKNARRHRLFGEFWDAHTELNLGEARQAFEARFEAEYMD